MFPINEFFFNPVFVKLVPSLQDSMYIKEVSLLVGRAVGCNRHLNEAKLMAFFTGSYYVTIITINYSTNIQNTIRLLWISKPERTASFVLVRGVCDVFHLWCDTCWWPTWQPSRSLPFSCEQALGAQNWNPACHLCLTV